MSRGKRYDGEQKLNLKKVFAVLIAIAVIIMFVVGIKSLFNEETYMTQKTVALRYFPVYTNGKWGVINSSGDIIINPEYDEYIAIPDNIITIIPKIMINFFFMTSSYTKISNSFSLT